MIEESREARLTAAFVTLADTLTTDYDVVDLLDLLVRECTEILDVEAGGLMLADSEGNLQLVASTSEEAELVEIMQLNAGAGPCLDCYGTGAPVAVSDIDRLGDRWPGFRTAALEHGFQSVYAAPMKLRGDVIGTMNLLSTSTGVLNDRDIAVAQALTDVATIGILQERMIRESGLISEQLQRALDSRILIEQAKGVLSHTGQMGMDEAFTTMRGYARKNRLTLHTVAEGIISRTVDVLASEPVHKKEDSRRGNWNTREAG
jgi:GAF domain-containing protein